MGAPGAGAGSKEHSNVRAGAKSGRTQRGVKGKMPSHVCATRDCQRRTSAHAACSALAASWQRAGAAGGEQGRVGDVSHRKHLLEMAAGGEAPFSDEYLWHTGAVGTLRLCRVSQIHHSPRALPWDDRGTAGWLPFASGVQGRARACEGA